MRAASVLGARPRALARRIAARELAWLVPLALFAGTLALYLGTRSISLDDFDSFNFARAIGRFDVRANQPQPPGYPLYVVLARLLDGVVRDPQAALTLLSALCGALAVLAFWRLAADLGAGWAALPLATMPLFWLSSGMALSDVPGLAAGTLATLLLARGAQGSPHLASPTSVGEEPPNVVRLNVATRWLLAGAVAAGLAAGVRPQDAIVPLAVLVFYAAPKVGLRKLVACAGAFVAACLAWGAPLVASLGGPAAAWQALAGQSQYVGAADSLFARPLTAANVAARLAEFGTVFSAYFGGPADGGLPAFFALAAAIALLAVLARRGRWLALAWLLPYGLFMVLALRPDDPRKVLPAVPPMLLLLAGLKPRWLAAAACTGLAAWFAAAAAPLVATMDGVKAPPEQAAAYVAEAYSPRDTLIIAGSSYNAIRYRDPAFHVFLLDDLDPVAVQRELASGTYKNLVLLDKEGFTAPDDFVGVDSRTFERDPLVLPKAATVWLAAYRPLSELLDRDLSLPQGPVHVGTPEDVRYLTDGWYRPETIAGVTARWAGQQAQLRFWVDSAAAATLRLTGVAYPRGQELTVLVNGQPAAELAMPTDWAPYTISVPAAMFHSQAINTISLSHSVVASANSATLGQSLDKRPLAAAYSSFELSWR